MHTPPRPVVCTLLAVTAVLGDRAALKFCCATAQPFEPLSDGKLKKGSRKRRKQTGVGDDTVAVDYDAAWRHMKRTAVTPALLRRIADFNAPAMLTAGRVRRVERLMWTEDLDEDTARFVNLACRPLLAWCNSQIGIFHLFQSSSEAARGRLRDRLLCNKTTLLRATSPGSQIA